MTNSLEIRRGFIDIEDGDNPRVIHYYACGSGPPLILLHPSPASASQFVPLLPRLGEQVTAIAIDTPGYGYSDGFPEPANDLSPYTERLQRFQKAIGADRILLYGSATGAQIAVEYAKRYPESCHALVLDNIGDFPDEERERVMAGYFPDLAPDGTGSQLTRAWSMALDVMRFFPWNDNRREARLPARSIDPALTQKMLIQFLLAGPDYHKAYRAAFRNERAEALQAVTTKTIVIRSSGSIIRDYADRLDAFEMPANITMIPCGASIEERAATMIAEVKKSSAGLAGFAGPFPASRSHRQLAALPSGNTLFSIEHRGGDDAWLVLHDIGSSTGAIRSLIESMGRECTVIAPDLPGHGASDPTLDSDPSNYLSTCTTSLCERLAAANVSSLSVLCVGESAVVAFPLLAVSELTVKQVVLYNPTAAGSSIDLSPKRDGSHLTSLWHRLKNDALYFPADEWSPESALEGETGLCPERLSGQVLDLIRSADCYRAAEAASRAFDLAGAARDAKTRLRIYRTENTTAGDRSRLSVGSIAGVESSEGPACIPAAWRNAGQ